MQKKSVRIIVAAVLTLIFAAVMFYVMLPAINLQSEEFWMFLFYCLTFYAVAQLVFEVVNYKKKNKGIKILEQKPKVGKGAIAIICISILPLLVLVGGSAISSTFLSIS